jgi:uncharacterized membrane protein
MATEYEVMQIISLRNCLRKQLEEYELLKSMYSNPGEFQSDNPFLVNDIREFLNGNRSSVSEKLDYRIKLQLSESLKMELSFVLSHYYPTHEQPMIIIRTDSLSKQQEKQIKEAIEKFIEIEVDKSDPYIFQIITWIQDNIEQINQVTAKVEEVKSSAISLQRAWLWSHHIYSKIKRQDIMKLTKDHDLNGFMWPGKPGVLCFEGISESVDEVVKIIKGWQWQKLKVVKIEIQEENGDESFCRFKTFREILTSEDDGEGSKMDTSAFFKFLESHNSGNMKKELFGFD